MNHRRIQTHQWKALAIGAVACVTAASPAGAADLLALIDTGAIYSSSDNGTTWAPLATISVSDAVDIYAGESSSELFMGTRSGSIYRSTDAGVNWTAVGAITASDMAAMLVRTSGNVLALTETGSVYESVDDGTTFTPIAALTGSDHVSLTEIRFGLKPLYALTRTGGVFESTDNGASWTAVGAITTSAAREIRAVGTDLYVMTDTGNMAHSSDNGVTWMFVSTLSQVGMSALAASGTSLIAMSMHGHAATSADGLSWSWPGSINQLTVTALGTDEPTISSVDDRTPAVTVLALRSVFPNPGGNREPFSFVIDVPGQDNIAIDVYDVAGRRVASRARESFATAGAYTIVWTPGNLRSGVYFARVVGATGDVATHKFVVTR